MLVFYRSFNNVIEIECSTNCTKCLSKFRLLYISLDINFIEHKRRRGGGEEKESWHSMYILLNTSGRKVGHYSNHWKLTPPVVDTTLSCCMIELLIKGHWPSRDTPGYSANKTDHHYIAERSLKVALIFKDQSLL